MTKLSRKIQLEFYWCLIVVVAQSAAFEWLLELATAELGAGLMVMYFLWELNPTWTFLVYEKSPSAFLCCVWVLWNVLVSHPVDSPECFGTDLAGCSSLTACLLKLFTENRSCVVITRGVSIFEDWALEITAPFFFDLRITKEIQLISPSFPERQALSLELLCEKSKCRWLFLL